MEEKELTWFTGLPQHSRRILLLLLSVLFCLTVSAQQQITAKGSVLSSDNEPIVGATILQTGTSNGTVTDINGEFTITVPAGSMLKISYIGFQTQDVKASSQSLHIVLKEEDKSLDEVVVMGYGVQKKKLVTGATVQVNGKDLEKLNTVSPLGALQSKTPGVTITQSSGMPGEGYKVNIRGLGTTGDSTPLYIIDGVAGGNINGLNPADIESVDVLKDAASAAIYGSRAANGVILVTTRQGKAGKAQISYDGYVGVQNVYRMPDLLNAKEYAMIMNEERMQDGLTPYNFASLVPNWSDIESGNWNGTNWMEEIRNKNALITNHAVNIAGGNDRSTFSIGLSYTYQDGILGKPCEPNFSRYTARINSEHKIIQRGKLDVFTVGENLLYDYTQNQGISIGDNYGNDLRNMLLTSPFLPNLNADGSYHYAIPWEIREPNPIAKMYNVSGNNQSKSHGLRAALYAVLQPVKGLRLKTNLGFTLGVDSYRSYTPVYKLSSNIMNDADNVYQSLSAGCSLTWENTANYVFTLGGKHHFDALLGQSIEADGLGESITGSNTNSQFDDFKHAYLVNTSAITARTTLTGSPWGKETLASFFGRVNYDYQDKYMATFVLRADGSSKFARGHQWGYFPSVSAGWVLTEEPFMSSTRNWLSFLKLRASWGQNGNQSIPGYQYLSTISFTNIDYTFGKDKSVITNGAYPDILANPNITWEKSEQTDLGFDSHFFSGKLGLTFDYYIKRTRDWLVQAPILDTAGTNAPYINGGDVRNSGIELALSWNDHIGDFSYGANLNFAYNKNKVTRIANTEGIIHGEANVLSNGTDEVYRAQVGYPIGYFYGYKTAGIFQTQDEIDHYTEAKLSGARPGDVIWVDTNHDGVIDLNDRCMIGDPHPDCTLGFSVNMAWRGFDVSATMNGAFGNQIMKSYRSFADYPKNNFTSDILDRWHGAGTSTRWPRLTSGTSTNWQFISDLYVENGDFMRMQNVTVGYDFKHLFKTLPFEQLRLYFSANNLFTITGYSGMDPEVGYGGTAAWASGIDLGFYPSPRVYMIGVNVKF
ncbi:TonB-dependent receptor [Prevotella salivae]|uniref:SusC/RagA family TonB-linked outer membrane protein n=1 Tax=Segatella salivae TaxID=228604 RepID=UPI001C6067DE|nr:TonB-dependent receptor [Segatella salivae]MBW4906354.1 TonB-dependent receptor [Segatella salivae]